MPTRLQPHRKGEPRPPRQPRRQGRQTVESPAASRPASVRGEVITTGAGRDRYRNGRVPGPLTMLNRAVANRLAEDGDVMPLEVMVENMRWFKRQAEAKWREADSIDPSVHEVVEDQQEAEAKKRMLLNESLERRLQAQQCATEAAPYTHSRLQAIAVGSLNNVPVVLMPHPDDARA